MRLCDWPYGASGGNTTTTFLMSLLKTAGAVFSPKGMYLNWYRPDGVANAAIGFDSSDVGICQYPLAKSIFEKNFFCDTFPNIVSIQAIGSQLSCNILFTCRKSTQSPIVLSGFFTTTAGEEYCNTNFSIIPC